MTPRNALDRFANSAPWQPTSASWATLFLLPLAGSVVTAVNLFRMRRTDKAIFALLTGLASLLFLLVVWSLSSIADRFLPISYIVISIGDIGLFLYLQAEDFSAWQEQHPKQQPASSWGAAAWALVGFGAMLMIAVIWMLALLLLTTAAPGLALVAHARF